MKYAPTSRRIWSGELGSVGNQVRHRQESTLEDGVEVLVSLLETLTKLPERVGNLVGRELEDPTDQLLPTSPSVGPDVFDRHEGLHDAPLGIRCESHRHAGYRDGGHQRTAVPRSPVEQSAATWSAAIPASVDSAPRFSLTECFIRPSEVPPVSTS